MINLDNITNFIQKLKEQNTPITSITIMESTVQVTYQLDGQTTESKPEVVPSSKSEEPKPEPKTSAPQKLNRWGHPIEDVPSNKPEVKPTPTTKPAFVMKYNSSLLKDRPEPKPKHESGIGSDEVIKEDYIPPHVRRAYKPAFSDLPKEKRLDAAIKELAKHRFASKNIREQYGTEQST